MGFELHDVSSELNKQGTLTAYRVPQTHTERQFLVGDINNIDNTFYLLNVNGVASQGGYFGSVAPRVYDTFSSVPQRPTDAMLYSGSRVWEAKDGAYVVQTFASENPMREDTSGYYAILAGDLIAYPAPQFAAPFGVHDAVAIACVDTVFNPTLNRYRISGENQQRFLPLPMDTKGVFLTGLNPLSVFELTYYVTTEFAPSFSDGDSSLLVPLATPSPDYDRRALELAQALWSRLPVAVPVNFNASGDWWEMVKQVARDYFPGMAIAAGGALQMTDNPYAQGAGIALGSAGQIAKHFRDDTSFKPTVRKVILSKHGVTTKGKPRSSSKPQSARGRSRSGQRGKK